MYCKQCGFQIDDDAAFCPNCGCTLAESTEQTYYASETVTVTLTPDSAKEKKQKKTKEKPWKEPLTGKQRTLSKAVAILSLLVILASIACAVFGGVSMRAGGLEESYVKVLDFLKFGEGSVWQSIINIFNSENIGPTTIIIAVQLIFMGYAVVIMLIVLLATLIAGIIRVVRNFKTGTDAKVGGAAVGAFLALVGGHIVMIAIQATEMSDGAERIYLSPNMPALIGMGFGAVTLAVILGLRIAIVGKAAIKANKSAAHIAMAVLTAICTAGLLYALSCPLLGASEGGVSAGTNFLSTLAVLLSGSGENMDIMQLAFCAANAYLVIVLILMAIGLLARIFRNISYPTEKVHAGKSPMLVAIFLLLFCAEVFVTTGLYIGGSFTYINLLLLAIFAFLAFVFSIVDFCVRPKKK